VTPPVVSLLYHDVCDDPSASGFRRRSALPYKHSKQEFELNLEAIGRAGRTPALVTAGEDDEHRGHRLMLTFDDGGKSALHIADALEARAWRGHFFITTGRIGSDGFVSRADVSELHRRGHVVGSHSHSHPTPFNADPLEKMRAEWTTSREILEDLVSDKVVTASVPGGDISPDAMRSAAECGIEYLFTSEPTSRPWRSHGITCLGRLCLKRGTPLIRVERLSRNRGLWREQLVRKAKNGARVALGPLYVRWVRSRQGRGIS
jgi:peptidoglycan/xylan/chitin deacetylase (PgdA/CDA1 family)